MGGGTISVIIPVYNVEKYLRSCLDSIINQTYTNLEIILVDDGSPDGSGAICDEYAQKDKRIRIMHKENGGVSSARNCGMRSAAGDYIAFVDADDFVDTRYFEILMADAKKHNADIVCCDCAELENGYDGADTGRFPLVKESKVVKNIEQFYKDIKNHQNYGYVVWGKIIKRELALSETFEDIKYSEDYLYMLRLFAKNPTTYLDTYKGYYYIRWDNSATLRYGKINLKKAIDYIYVMRERLDIFKNCSDEKIVRECVENYAHSIYSCLSIIIMVGDNKTYIAEKPRMMRYIEDCFEYGNVELKYRFMLRLYGLNSRLYWCILRFVSNVKGKRAKV